MRSRRRRVLVVFLLVAAVCFLQEILSAGKKLPAQTPNKSFCDERLRECKLQVLSEISRIVQSHAPVNNCAPRLVEVPCSANFSTPFRIHCNRSASGRLPSIVIEEYNFHTQLHCIERLANRILLGGSTKIPRIGHSVYLYSPNSSMKFHQYLSVLSLVQHLQPKALFFWNAGLPTGRWWNELVMRVHGRIPESYLSDTNGLAYTTSLYSIYRERPRMIYDAKITEVEHSSDVIRLEALLRFGGVYLDFDAFAVRRLDALLNQSWVQGYEAKGRLNNGVLFGAPYAAFGFLWHCEYVDFNRSWLEHSVIRPHLVAERCPHTIRRENSSLCKPSNYPESNGEELLYGEGIYFSLSNNFAVHAFMWILGGSVDELNPQTILDMNTTMGRIWRSIYYNHPLEAA